jgi:hypothetical protein
VTINCPHGLVWRGKIGAAEIEDRTVSVYGGVCASADRCGISACKYFDLSPHGDFVFRVAACDGETIEGIVARKREPRLDLERDHPRHLEALHRALEHQAPRDGVVREPN